MKQIKCLFFIITVVAFLGGCDLRQNTGLDVVDRTGENGDTASKIIPVIKFVQPALNQAIQCPYTVIYTVTDDREVSTISRVFAGVTNNVPINSSNTYNYLLQSLPDGLHPIIIIATDNDGNTTFNAMSVLVESPKGTPSITWLNPTDNAWICSTTFNGQYYVNSGDLYTNNPINIYTNSVLFGTPTHSSGSWSLSFDATAYSDGDALVLRAIIKADSEKEATNTINVHIDKSLPVLANISPTNNETVDNTGFTISGEAYDIHSGILATHISIDSEWSTTLTSSNFNFTYDGVLYGGNYNFIITTSNNAKLTTATTNIITVLYKPQSTITSPATGTCTTNTTVDFAGTASIEGGYNISSVMVLLSNAGATVSSNATGTDSWNTTIDIIALDEGVFYAYAYAYADNGSDNSNIISPITIYKDTEAPTNYIDTTLVETNRKNFLYTINGYSYDGGSGIDTVKIAISNVNSVSTNTVYANGATTLNWSKGVYITLGTNAIEVFTLDKAGRKSASKNKTIVGNRSITIDGDNDFDGITEKFDTTDAGIDAYITWNSDAIYIGYNAGDIGNAKVFQSGADYEIWWLLVYISTNTNDASGTHIGLNYSSQEPVLPFKAHYHFRVQADNAWRDLQEYTGSWGTATYNGSVSHSGDYMEISFPLSDLGNKTKYYVMATMIYEDQAGNSGSTYGGLYSDNFVDGSDPDYTKFVAIDINDITTAPNSAGFKKTGDYIPPTVSITNPANNSITSNTSVTISGTANDVGSSVASVYHKLNNGSFVLLSGTTSWSTNLTSLSTGKYTNLVYAVDSYGNTSSTQENVFTVAAYETYHTISIDGVNDFYTNSEKFTANDSKTMFLTWDANKIYFGFESEDMTVDNKAFYVVISTNTTYGTNKLPYAQWFEGSTVTLPIKAQFLFYFKRNTSTEKYKRVFDGSVWDNSGHTEDVSGDFSDWAGSSYSEYFIKRSLIGNPTTPIYIMNYVKDLANVADPGWGWFFAPCPEDGTVSGGINDKTLNKWIEVTLDAGVVPNDSSHIKP